MCFSPVASFVTAGLTGSIGLVCLTRVSHPRELPLAATPLIFGVQQALEGGLWLNLPTAPHSPLVAGLTLAFLLFAEVFWPVYAPLAAWSLEPDARRRRLMLACLAIGVGVASVLLWRLLIGPRVAEIANSCIVYRTTPGDPIPIGLAYLTATSLPLVLSSRRTILVLGLVTLTGCIVAYAFYWAAFLSVWCFFAAAASIVILSHFELNRWRSLRAAAAT